MGDNVHLFRMADYKAYKTGGREIAVDTPRGQYRFVHAPEQNLVLVPSDAYTDSSLMDAVRDHSEVDDVFNHDAISAIRRP